VAEPLAQPSGSRERPRGVPPAPCLEPGVAPRLLVVAPAEVARCLAIGAPILGVVGYGTTASLGESGPAGPPRLEIPLPPLGDPALELWLGDEPAEVSRHGRWHVARSGGALFAAGIGYEGVEGDLEALTARLYRELLTLTAEFGYPYLWRMWNCLPWINRAQHGLERYKRFCRARADAFAAVYGPRFEPRLCASTAVGSHDGGALVLHFLAGREPGSHHENPRQVSAYRYPLEYGPRSPSFARATLVGGGTLLVSGTASIVGHRTVHAGEAATQLAETVRNVRALLGTGDREARVTAVKTYLRDPELLPLVAGKLARELPGAAASFVHADVCREDLLLEIEAVATVAPAPARPPSTA
jgi:chorismate lyase/3-hydroxybenzoate synthase